MLQPTAADTPTTKCKCPLLPPPSYTQKKHIAVSRVDHATQLPALCTAACRGLAAAADVLPQVQGRQHPSDADTPTAKQQTLTVPLLHVSRTPGEASTWTLSPLQHIPPPSAITYPSPAPTSEHPQHCGHTMHTRHLPCLCLLAWPARLPHGRKTMAEIRSQKHAHGCTNNNRSESCSALWPKQGHDGTCPMHVVPAGCRVSVTCPGHRPGKSPQKTLTKAEIRSQKQAHGCKHNSCRESC
jgi:hypothetical protein